MFENEIFTFSAIGIVAMLVLALVLLGFILRKKDKRLAALIAFLSASYIVVYAVWGIFRFSPTTYILTGPLAVVQSVLGIVIGVLLAFRFFSSHIFTGITRSDAPDYSVPLVLKESVSKILDSENLLTALRSTLPTGKDDDKFGFDYIPFMLSAIDERRKRSQRAARFFLIATTISALIFSGVVMYFGYILVNEASAGTAKTLADIKISTEATSEAIHSIIPNYYNNPEFKKNVTPALDKLVQLEPGEKNKQTREKIVDVINEAKRTADFVALNSALIQAGSGISKETDQEKIYSTALADATNGMSAFMGSQSVAIPELNSRIKELKDLIPKAEDALAKPENRLPEIIKRLALGLVIATFFLALLRYMGTLYRTRYQQVLAAENDDFMVRRFYVGFKSSQASDEQRKAVLSGFMAAQTAPARTGAKESEDGTKEQYEVLKELLGALGKRL